MKRRRPTNPAAPIAPAIRRAPLCHEAIALRAHELWVAQGHPENCDKAIWLEAEDQLVAAQRQVQPRLGVHQQPDAQTIFSASLAAAPALKTSLAPSVPHEQTECQAVTAWRNEGDPN